MKARDWSLDDWRLSDRDPLKVAAVAAVALALVLGISFNFTRLPLINQTHDHSAYLESASGLIGNETVQIRGVRVGKLTGITLVEDQVRVDFKVDDGIKLGEDTEARVKVLNPLGSQFLELVPIGEGELEKPIPVERTYVSRTLLGELGRVTNQVESIDLPQLELALDTVTENLSETSATAVRRALIGLNTFAGNLAEDSDAVGDLISEGADLAELLNSRSGELVNIVVQGDAVLKVLTSRRNAIRALVRGTAKLSKQVTQILDVNKSKLTPMLASLEDISTSLAQENRALSRSIPAMAQLSDSITTVTGTGPFVDVVVPNGLVPDSVINQCADKSSYPAPGEPQVGCRP